MKKGLDILKRKIYKELLKWKEEKTTGSSTSQKSDGLFQTIYDCWWYAAGS